MAACMQAFWPENEGRTCGSALGASIADMAVARCSMLVQALHLQPATSTRTAHQRRPQSHLRRRGVRSAALLGRRRRTCWQGTWSCCRGTSKRRRGATSTSLALPRPAQRQLSSSQSPQRRSRQGSRQMAPASVSQRRLLPPGQQPPKRALAHRGGWACSLTCN